MVMDYDFVEWFGDKNHLPPALLLGAKRCALRNDANGVRECLAGALKQAKENQRENQAVLDDWAKESNLRIYVDEEFTKMTGVGL